MSSTNTMARDTLTLPFTVPVELVRITKTYRGRQVQVSGVLSRTKAERRMAKLAKRNVHDTYSITPVDSYRS